MIMKKIYLVLVILGLFCSGKCFGEIGMTLAYNPILDDRYGREYCRTNIDVSFGTYKHTAAGDP